MYEPKVFSTRCWISLGQPRDPVPILNTSYMSPMDTAFHLLLDGLYQALDVWLLLVELRLVHHMVLPHNPVLSGR